LFVYASFTVYGLETRHENSDVLQLDMQLIVNQNSPRTCVRPTKNIRVLTLEIQPISSVYEFNTRLTLSNEVRVHETDI